MGNRAKIYFEDNGGGFSCGIYLHWNGGADSIYPFLAEFNRRNYGHDKSYNAARLTQVIGEFFDENGYTSTSLGIIAPLKKFDEKTLKYSDEDNGIFIIGYKDDEFTVVKRYCNVIFTQKQINAEKKEAEGSTYNLGLKSLFISFAKHKLQEQIERQKAENEEAKNNG